MSGGDLQIYNGHLNMVLLNREGLWADASGKL